MPEAYFFSEVKTKGPYSLNKVDVLKQRKPGVHSTWNHDCQALRIIVAYPLLKEYLITICKPSFSDILTLASAFI